MGTFLLILLAVLAIAWLIFQPNFDNIELYCGESWVIVWYNHYYVFQGKIKCERSWQPLFSLDR